MKKVVLTVVIMTFTLGLLGCNKDIIDTNYTFKKAIIVIGGEKINVEIKQWKDFSDGDQIQITDKNDQVYLTHSTNVLLLKK